jgi:hypothetical protein
MEAKATPGCSGIEEEEEEVILRIPHCVLTEKFYPLYRSCRCSVLLFHCIQLLNSSLSAIPVKCVIVSGFTYCGSLKLLPTPFISAQRLSERTVYS